MELGTTSLSTGTAADLATYWLTVWSQFYKDLLRAVELKEANSSFNIQTMVQRTQASRCFRNLWFLRHLTPLSFQNGSTALPLYAHHYSAVVLRDVNERQHGQVALPLPFRCTVMISKNVSAFWILMTVIKDNLGSNSFSASFKCSHTVPN